MSSLVDQGQFQRVQRLVFNLICGSDHNDFHGVFNFDLAQEPM